MATDLNIKILEGSSEAYITLNEGGGSQRHKVVSTDELIGTMTSMFLFSTGILPINTRFYSGTKSEFLVGVETPAKIRRFMRQDRGKVSEFNIPFPHCLFIFKVSGKRISNTKLFALDKPLQSEKDTLFQFPFGNVYDDGHICWGANALPAINQPIHLSDAITLFFDAPFNGDLFSESGASTSEVPDVTDFWSLVKYLDKKSIFPSNMLKRTDYTISRFMRGANE